MTVLIILGILLILGIGILIGYKIGIYFTQQQIQVVEANNIRLQQYCNEWSSVARNNTELTGTIAQQQITNVSSTMSTVIQLLSTLQTNQPSVSQKEENVIQNILDQANSLSPHAELEY